MGGISFATFFPFGLLPCCNILSIDAISHTLTSTIKYTHTQLHYQAHLDDWRAGPMGLASAQQAYLRTRRNPADGQINPMDVTVPPLPEGWKEELDEATGVYFYVNEESGKRSWVRPNFRPPGPGGPPPPPMMGGGPPMMGGTCLQYIAKMSCL